MSPPILEPSTNRQADLAMAPSMTRVTSTYAADETALRQTRIGGTSPRYAWYVLLILVFGQIINFMDRMLLNVLVDPIKAEFGASDTQMGLLTGFVFVVVYATAGLVMARLADLKSRRTLLALGIIVWSGMTVVSGFARSYIGLAAARMGVAAAESASGPTSFGLISDYFAKEKRPLAYGIMQSTVFLGLFAGFIVAGVIGERYGWRSAFFVAGVPGIVLGVVIWLTVREPVRGAMEAQGVNHGDASASFMQNLKWLTNRRAYLLIILGTAFVAMAGYSYLVWSASFLRRVHGLSGSDAGIYLALAISLPGSLGTLFGGFTGTWLQRRGISADKRTLRLCGISMMVAVPFYAAFLTVPDLTQALVLLGVASFVAGFPTGPAIASAMSVVRVSMRSQAVAIMTIMISFIGQGGGALIVGVISDHYAATAGAASVQYGLFAALIGNLIAFICYWLSSNRYDEEFQSL